YKIMQSFVPLELLLLTLPIIAPTGVHQLPLQLRHNYTAYRRQLGRFRDVYGSESERNGRFPSASISLSNMLGLANLGLIAVGTPGKCTRISAPNRAALQNSILSSTLISLGPIASSWTGLPAASPSTTTEIPTPSKTSPFPSTMVSTQAGIWRPIPS
ncbi:hypothetical protein AAVH_41338, partial [Aphelenchoides avenae]